MGLDKSRMKALDNYEFRLELGRNILELGMDKLLMVMGMCIR